MIQLGTWWYKIKRVISNQEAMHIKNIICEKVILIRDIIQGGGVQQTEEE